MFFIIRSTQLVVMPVLLNTLSMKTSMLTVGVDPSLSPVLTVVSARKLLWKLPKKAELFILFVGKVYFFTNFS